MGTFKIYVFALLFIALIPNNSFDQKLNQRAVFPISSPEQQGVNPATLDSMIHFIKRTNQNIHQLTIIRNNHSILNADFYPYSSRFFHDVASVTKSITSLLIGIAIDKKFIKSENEIVLKFFPEILNANKDLDSLKIKDLVTMTSGFACSASDGEKALSEMRKSHDWIKFIFNLPITTKPGTVFSYCSCNYYLLSEIIFRTSGLTPLEFARKYFFSPLQIFNTKWLYNYKKINHGWGDLFLLPADMVKIGKVILDKGKWQNKQLISKEWIDKSLSTYSKLPDDKGYGYGWWTNEKAGYYEAAGRGRQTISVIPSKNMIVIMLGGEFDAGTIGNYIFQSLQNDKAIPANKISFANLKKSVREATLPPPSQVLSVNDRAIRKLNRKMILFEKNIMEIDSLLFNFSSKSNGVVTFYKNQRREIFPFKISSNTYSMSKDPELQLPVALKTISKNENEFVLHYNQLCRINNFYFHFSVDKDTITTRLEETSNGININIRSSFR